MKFSEKFAGKVSKASAVRCAASLRHDTQVVLMTNVASACGYTRSNYQELVALHDKYNKQGLEIVAFPCNQVRACATPALRAGGAVLWLRRGGQLGGTLTACSVTTPVWPPGKRVSG